MFLQGMNKCMDLYLFDVKANFIDIDFICLNLSLGVSSVQSDRDHSENLRRELNALKNNFERERKEIEYAYKLEIAGIEDKHDLEKAELQKQIDRGKVNVIVKRSYSWKMYTILYQICNTNIKS